MNWTSLRLGSVTPEVFAWSPDSEVWARERTVLRGQKIQIAAPSGSGKSSLLAYLRGTDHRYRGSITFSDGNESLEPAGMPLSKRQKFCQTELSAVAQAPRFLAGQNLQRHFELVVGGDLDFARRLAGEFELPSDKRAVQTFSRGEQQRASLIFALMRPFSLLLLDEAFAHQDDRRALPMARAIASRVEELGAALIACELHTSEAMSWDSVWRLA